jgi:hypothetical protein
MTLQSVMADLTMTAERGGCEPCAAHDLARRLVALYDTCPICADWQIVIRGEGVGRRLRCERCGGSGVVAVGIRWSATPEPYIEAKALAALLFREGERP